MYPEITIRISMAGADTDGSAQQMRIATRGIPTPPSVHEADDVVPAEMYMPQATEEADAIVFADIPLPPSTDEVEAMAFADVPPPPSTEEEIMLADVPPPPIVDETEDTLEGEP